MSLPAPLCDYLCRVAIEQQSPAYLLVSPTGRLLDWGGSWATYGVDDLRLGEAVCEQIFFLEGLLPLNGLELSLPQLKTDSGWCADVYFFPGKAGDWVLLLDASKDERQAQLLQQHRHNFNLLQSHYAQLHSPFSPAPDLAADRLPIAEHRNLTILSVSLREFAAYSEQHPAPAIFNVLNCYVRAMTEAIVSEAGSIEHLSGETMTAYFGILPAVTPTASRAVQAAQKIRAVVQNINQFRRARAQVAFEVAMGIASGSIALGWVGNPTQQSLGAIGNPVSLAATLQQQAKPGEILIDATTMQAADAQQYFTPSARDVSIAEFVQRDLDCLGHE